MSLNGKLIDVQTSQQQQLSISIPVKNEQEMPMHQIHEDTAKIENEDKNKRTPDNSTIGTRIVQILNSVHKKPVMHFLVQKYSTSYDRPATPDYTRVSHYRECQQTSCRSLRLANKEPPRGPFFISFKKKPVMIETNYYNERCHMSFFDQSFSNKRCIGKGSFGEVFKAFNKDDKRWYAVKISIEPFRSSSDRDIKLKEVQKHELLPKHPNLISYIRAWEEYGFLYIQTELCQCSLLDYKMKVGTIAEKDLWLFFGDIAQVCHFRYK
ncbi:unnamed protein product [Onchocerca flexuosa]|uniref:non-specific serine/threonine protein kinase n=1 Tax=Onchocerca flexuosa TaxID=387005 RepID=A0A183H662_9BILA|nr:unnamed protein product [Onchocerca flexuosa]